MKIRKGDTVLIISGKDRARKGKVLESFPKKGKILVEGINLRKKHQKPKRTGEKGQIISLPASIDVSNVKLICPKCGKATRVEYKIISKIPEGKPSASYGAGKNQKPAPYHPSKARIGAGSKIRICKKCGQEI